MAVVLMKFAVFYGEQGGGRSDDQNNLLISFVDFRFCQSRSTCRPVVCALLLLWELAVDHLWRWLIRCRLRLCVKLLNRVHCLCLTALWSAERVKVLDHLVIYGFGRATRARPVHLGTLHRAYPVPLGTYVSVLAVSEWLGDEPDDYDSVYWLLAPREPHTLARSPEVDFEMPPTGAVWISSSPAAEPVPTGLLCTAGRHGGRASMNHC
jgi:hypothetical protein